MKYLLFIASICILYSCTKSEDQLPGTTPTGTGKASFSVDGVSYTLPGITSNFNTTQPSAYATRSFINGQTYVNITLNTGGNSGLVMLLGTDTIIANHDYTATVANSNNNGFTYSKNNLIYQVQQSGDNFTLHINSTTNRILSGTFQGVLSASTGASTFQQMNISNGIIDNIQIVY